jgi:mono/diheme cytochrome c family protein
VVALGLAALLAGACGERGGGGRAVRRGEPGVRISMDALHRAGGVPPGWRLTPPPGDPVAGRRAFVDLGCPACHAIAGEKGSPTAGAGPDLSGMGSHHPPEYFVESILNPDAVLIAGPGYLDPDGHSVMPAYPDMTLAQLADLVAYLTAQVDPANPHAVHTTPPALAALPAPPPSEAKSFLVQTYDVREGRLADFEQWFAATGRPRFLTWNGLLGIDTFVDRRRPQTVLTTLFAFRDDDTLRRFLDDPGVQTLGQDFDGFIGDHPHDVFRVPPVYRAPSLSAP